MKCKICEAIGNKASTKTTARLLEDFEPEDESWEVDSSATIKNEKLNAILTWLDEYHMAFKDAKRWRVEFEKFLKKIL